MQPKIRIFLIDDDQNFLNIYSDLLRNEGFKVSTFTNGEKALLQLKENSKIPTIVITDINMPSISGIDILKQIRKDFSDLPVIITTAYHSSDIYLEALNNHATYLLPKPFEWEQLLIFIQKAQESYNLQLQNKMLLEKLKNNNTILEKYSFLLKETINALPLGVIVCDKEFKILYFNSQAESIFGIPAEHILKEPLWESSLDKNFLSQLNNIVMNPRKENFFEYQNENQDFLVKFIDLDKRFFIITLENLTELKKLQIELSEKEKKAQLTDFFSYLAHEIRNPLTGMESLSSYILENSKIRREEIQDIMRDFKREIERLKILTDNISILAKNYQNYPFHRNITFLEFQQDLLSSLRVLFLEKEKIKLSLDLNSDRYLPMPANLLKQILLNLVKNSTEALKQEEKTQKEIHLTLEERKTETIIHVEDNGPGFQNIEKITLKDNFTTKGKGEGIGLIICQNILKDFKGKLEFKNKKEGGAIVSIHLPYEK